MDLVLISQCFSARHEESKQSRPETAKSPRPAAADHDKRTAGWGVERAEYYKTKTGIIVYQRGEGDSVIDFPDGYHKYGRTSPAEVVSLFAYLAEGKSLEEARRKVGWR